MFCLLKLVTECSKTIDIFIIYYFKQNVASYLKWITNMSTTVPSYVPPGGDSWPGIYQEKTFSRLYSFQLYPSDTKTLFSAGSFRPDTKTLFLSGESTGAMFWVV